MAFGAIVIISELDTTNGGPKHTRFSVVGDGAYPAGGSVGLSFALAAAAKDGRKLFDVRKAGPNGNLDFEYTPLGAQIVGTVETVGGLFTTSPIPQGALPSLPAPVHGLSSGDAIYFEEIANANAPSPPVLPAGLAAKTPYYVIASGLTTTAFKFSATSGGSALIPTTTGAGALRVRKADKLLVRVPSTGSESGVADQSGSTYTMLGISQ